MYNASMNGHIVHSAMKIRHSFSFQYSQVVRLSPTFPSRTDKPPKLFPLPKQIKLIQFKILVVSRIPAPLTSGISFKVPGPYIRGINVSCVIHHSSGFWVTFRQSSKKFCIQISEFFQWHLLFNNLSLPSPPFPNRYWGCLRGKFTFWIGNVLQFSWLAQCLCARADAPSD